MHRGELVNIVDFGTDACVVSVQCVPEKSVHVDILARQTKRRQGKEDSQSTIVSFPCLDDSLVHWLADGGQIGRKEQDLRVCQDAGINVVTREIVEKQEDLALCSSHVRVELEDPAASLIRSLFSQAHTVQRSEKLSSHPCFFVGGVAEPEFTARPLVDEAWFHGMADDERFNTAICVGTKQVSQTDFVSLSA